jgi:flagellar hook-associated protein 3 FlgL
VRVTQNSLLKAFLAHTGSSLARMAQWQERISSGRNLLRASDSPSALSKSLAVRADLRQTQALLDNTSSATAHMSLTETALAETSDLVSRAKELLLQGMNDTTEVGGVDSLVRDLRSMTDELMLLANREVAGRRLFAGTATRTAPYARENGGAAYRGNDDDILEEISPGLRVAINLTGPDAFETVPSSILGTADLDPALSDTTLLRDLHGGRGAVGGQIRLTDSNGVSVDLDLSAAENLGQVVQAVNNAGTAIVASYSPDGKSLVLTDTGGGPGVQVQDILGGTLAQSLGIATTSDTNVITGADLDPAVTDDTALALLLGGAGIGPGAWTIRNNSQGVERVAVIDPSQANTVGELRDLIEGAVTAEGEPLGIAATVEGSSLHVQSTRLHTTLSISDAGGSSALALGVAGTGDAQDLFELIDQAAEAVESRDHDAMDRLVAQLTTAVENTAGIRGTYGARARQVISLGQSLQNQTVDLTIRLSDLEDVDLAEAAMELSRAETVYNASLAVGTRIFERNLFDYIR